MDRVSKPTTARSESFKKKSTTIDSRSLRAHRRSQEWKQLRQHQMNQNRNIEMSPVQEEIKPLDNRRMALQKWKEEKELKRKLAKAQEKPTFKVSVTAAAERALPKVKSALVAPAPAKRVTRASVPVPAASSKITKQGTKSEQQSRTTTNRVSAPQKPVAAPTNKANAPATRRTTTGSTGAVAATRSTRSTVRVPAPSTQSVPRVEDKKPTRASQKPAQPEKKVVSRKPAPPPVKKNVIERKPIPTRSGRAAAAQKPTTVKTTAAKQKPVASKIKTPKLEPSNDVPDPEVVDSPEDASQISRQTPGRRSRSTVKEPVGSSDNEEDSKILQRRKKTPARRLRSAPPSNSSAEEEVEVKKSDASSSSQKTPRRKLRSRVAQSNSSHEEETKNRSASRSRSRNAEEPRETDQVHETPSDRSKSGSFKRVADDEELDLEPPRKRANTPAVRRKRGSKSVCSEEERTPMSSTPKPQPPGSHGMKGQLLPLAVSSCSDGGSTEEELDSLPKPNISDAGSFKFTSYDDNQICSKRGNQSFAPSDFAFKPPTNISAMRFKPLSPASTADFFSGSAVEGSSDNIFTPPVGRAPRSAKQSSSKKTPRRKNLRNSLILRTLSPEETVEVLKQSPMIEMRRRSSAKKNQHGHPVDPLPSFDDVDDLAPMPKLNIEAIEEAAVVNGEPENKSQADSACAVSSTKLDSIDEAMETESTPVKDNKTTNSQATSVENAQISDLVSQEIGESSSSTIEGREPDVNSNDVSNEKVDSQKVDIPSENDGNSQAIPVDDAKISEPQSQETTEPSTMEDESADDHVNSEKVDTEKVEIPSETVDIPSENDENAQVTQAEDAQISEPQSQETVEPPTMEDESTDDHVTNVEVDTEKLDIPSENDENSQATPVENAQISEPQSQEIVEPSMMEDKSKDDNVNNEVDTEKVEISSEKVDIPSEIDEKMDCVESALSVGNDDPESQENALDEVEQPVTVNDPEETEGNINSSEQPESEDTKNVETSVTEESKEIHENVHSQSSELEATDLPENSCPEVTSSEADVIAHNSDESRPEVLEKPEDQNSESVDMPEVASNPISDNCDNTASLDKSDISGQTEPHSEDNVLNSPSNIQVMENCSEAMDIDQEENPANLLETDRGGKDIIPNNETSNEQDISSDPVNDSCENESSAPQESTTNMIGDSSHSLPEPETITPTEMMDTAEDKTPEPTPEQSVVESSEAVFVPEPTADGHDVKYFQDLIVSETARLNVHCDTWDSINSPDLSEEVQGEIRTTTGQAQLLIAQRFKQFSGLIDKCQNNTGEKPIHCSDLQGFWDMIYFQVEDVDAKFDDLTKRKAKNWETDKPVVEQKKKIIKKKITKSTKPKVAVKSSFAAFRAKMKHQQEAPPQIPGSPVASSQLEEETKTFDAGFFKINSPVASPRICCSPAGSPVNHSSSRNTPNSSLLRISFEKSLQKSLSASPALKSPSQPSGNLLSVPAGRVESSLGVDSCISPLQMDSTRQTLSMNGEQSTLDNSEMQSQTPADSSNSQALVASSQTPVSRLRESRIEGVNSAVSKSRMASLRDPGALLKRKSIALLSAAVQDNIQEPTTANPMAMVGTPGKEGPNPTFNNQASLFTPEECDDSTPKRARRSVRQSIQLMGFQESDTPGRSELASVVENSDDPFGECGDTMNFAKFLMPASPAIPVVNTDKENQDTSLPLAADPIVNTPTAKPDPSILPADSSSLLSSSNISTIFTPPQRMDTPVRRPKDGEEDEDITVNLLCFSPLS